ncbi:hypothetical protein GDO81_001838 [Engystomops pustulosus]|uniref:Ig-like domain-containing protein n=1 Tax=Engystomops pustulosus TaxID=76066 RepID=A0AAV7DJE9_ENGPU|nr:hypothetical protein GDO81_001838 [Engystomops pustulosus]
MILWNMFFLKAAVLLSVCSSCTCNVIQIAGQDGTAGEDVNLECDHATITTGDYIQWYRLYPGQGPVFLIGSFQDTVLKENKYKMTFAKDRKSSVLHILDVKAEDSAVYLCAQRDTQIHTDILPVQYNTNA